MLYSSLGVGAFTGMSVSADGNLLVTSSEEKSFKIFDIQSFGAPEKPNHYFILGVLFMIIPIPVAE